MLTDHLIYEWTTDEARKICLDYHSRIENLENEKYDFEYLVKGKDYQVHIKIAKAVDETIEKNYFPLTQKSSFSNFCWDFFHDMIHSINW